MFHDLCSIPLEAGSSKNRETPFREEIGFEALRTGGVDFFFRFRRRTVAEFLAWVHPNENTATLSFFQISGN